MHARFLEMSLIPSSLHSKLRYLFTSATRRFSAQSQRPLASVIIEQENSNDKKQEGSDSKEESGPWSGKNAWKLGALAMAGSTAFTVGCVIAVWGKFFANRRLPFLHRTTRKG